MSQQSLVALRNVLIELYPDEASIRRITADAGIDMSRIAFNGMAVNAWHSVLREAEKLGRADALLDAVEGEYGNNQEFRRACGAYRQIVSKNSHPKLNGPNLRPTSTWHRHGFALFLGLLIIGIASVGWDWGWFNLGTQLVSTPPATLPTLNSPAPAEELAVVAMLSPTIPTATAISVPTLPTTKAVTITAETKLPVTEPAASENTPTASPNPSSTPTPQPTTTPIPTPTMAKTYPCEAEIFEPTSGNIVNLVRAVPSSGGALLKGVLDGTKVKILKQSGSSEIWYHIFDGHDRELGWILSRYVRRSASCPD